MFTRKLPLRPNRYHKRLQYRSLRIFTARIFLSYERLRVVSIAFYDILFPHVFHSVPIFRRARSFASENCQDAPVHGFKSGVEFEVQEI